MNPSSDSSSSGADSDSGFDFATAPLSAKPATASGLPVPKPAKPTKPRARTRATAPAQTAAIQIDAIDTESEIPQSVTDRLHRNRSQLSSFVTSTILHTVVFLVLALWALDRQADPPEIGLMATLDMADVEEAFEPSEIKLPEIAESPTEDVAEDTSTEVEEMAAADVPTVVDEVSEEEVIPDAVDPAKVASLKTLPSGGGLQGRDAQSRARLAAKYGGSPGSEAAVELGLKWIVNHQLTDGSWRFRHNQSACNGRCENEGGTDAPTAATGLALMSLLGAGHTQEAGPYKSQIDMGLTYLLNEIKYRGYGGSLRGSGSSTMYAHAIATIALAEAWALTGDDERFRKPVSEAYKYIVTAQHRRGGWKYTPQKPGDMSVTGWIIMAVKACENAGVETDAKSTKLAKEFVNSLAYEDGVQYGYEIMGRGDLKPGALDRKPSCTAIGNLLQMYFGREIEHPTLKTACQFLASAGSSDSDIYYNYYATLVLHHARAPAWKKWNQTVRDQLIRTQQRNGHEAGSWFFPDLHGNVGGRLYTTAMAVMTLEVYYRFMPLYELDDDR